MKLLFSDAPFFNSLPYFSGKRSATLVWQYLIISSAAHIAGSLIIFPFIKDACNFMVVSRDPGNNMI
jgi:hypothetical protein